MNDHCWYIDPLDGTINYAHAIPIFAVSIAYRAHGKTQLGVVYDPLREECFSAERGKGAWLNDEPIHVSTIQNLVEGLLVTGFPYEIRALKRNNLAHFSYFSLNAQAVRRLGSAALDLCYVACGRFDGYWELALKPWDLAAGALICEEAGGIVSNFKGNPEVIDPPCELVAANPHLHPVILAGIHGVDKGLLQ